ncbi:MAG: hypothetical protein AB7V42_06170 [Thermoleophilia bacterium]
MSREERALIELTYAAFEAEGHLPADGWRAVLRGLLAEDFRLRRSTGEVEDREQMIARLGAGPAVRRKLLARPAATILGAVGLVRSQVGIAVDGRTEIFRNLQLCEFGEGGWRCVYWRVTRDDRLRGR